MLVFIFSTYKFTWVTRNKSKYLYTSFKIIEVMAKIITVKVSKGGVGKTTITSNLAHTLANKDKKVLVIDLDSQGNLSKNFLREFDDEKLTSSNLLGDNEINLQDFIYEVSDNLHLIASDIGLHEVSKYLEQQGEYYNRLRNVIDETEMENYDYVLFDLSPGVADTLTETSLVASDLLICPTHFDIDSLTGLVLTINDISRLCETEILENDLNYLVVPNRYDRRFRKDNETIKNMLYDNIDREFIAEPIRENSHIKKARMFGQTAIEYELDEKRAKEHNKAVEDFDKLAIKVMNILG